MPVLLNLNGPDSYMRLTLRAIGDPTYHGQQEKATGASVLQEGFLNLREYSS